MPEIAFTNLKQLKNVVSGLYEEQQGEALSPHKCIMIQQVDSDQTLLTTYQPRMQKFSRYLSDESSGGEKGTQFLLDHFSLIKEIDNFIAAKRRTVIFRPNTAGKVSLIGDEEVIDGKGVSKGQTYVEPYPGITEDFDPPENLKEENFVGSVTEDNFKSCLGYLRKFGGVNPNTDSAFYLHSEGGYLVFGTNYDISSAGYLFTPTPLKGNVQSFATSIFRRNIPKILTICGNETERDVNIYYNEETDWIEFRGVRGSFLCKGASANKQIKNALVMGNENHEHLSKRVFNIEDLHQSVSQFKNSKSDKLLLIEDDGVIRFFEIDNFSKYKYSESDLTLSSDSNDWVPCTIQGTMVASLLNSFKLVQKRAQVECNEISLTQKQIKRDDGEEPQVILTYLALNHNELADNCKGLLYAPKADYQLDQIDSDE